MKIIILIFLFFGTDTNPEDQFKADFNRIAAVFETNALPYIHKFVGLQVAPLPTNASTEWKTAHKLLIETKVMIHAKKLELMKDEVFKVLEREMSQSYSKEKESKIISSFEGYYQIELLYLDHAYYESVKSLLQKK